MDSRFIQIWGRDLLHLGLGWSVGTGSQIKVWSEPWLSSSDPLTPIGPPPSAASQDLLVSDLINCETMEWNLQAIRRHVPLYEECILQLIPSDYNKQDELIWLPEASGSYTSKSGYAMARKAHLPALNPEFPWKKCIWNLNTPPKIQTLLWRATNGALPVGHTLRVRGLQAEAKCKRCGEIETPLHLFFSCPFAARVWDLVPAMFKPVAGSVSTMRELLIRNTKMINLPPTGLGLSPIYPTLYWHLWKNRNRLLFEDKSLTESELLLRVLKDVRCWEEASQAEKFGRLTNTRSPPPPTLPTGLRCFADGAWDPASRNSGQGWVFTDLAGVEVRHHSGNRLHVAAPIVAEALAVKAALLDAVNHDFFQVVVLSDSKSLVNLLNSSSSTVLLHSVLFDIRVLSRRFVSISYFHIPRLQNVVADSLAKSALSSVVIPPLGE